MNQEDCGVQLVQSLSLSVGQVQSSVDGLLSVCLSLNNSLTSSSSCFFFMQGMLSQHQGACVHRATALKTLCRDPTVAGFFSTCVVGDSQAANRKHLLYHRDQTAGRLFSGHSRLLNQDNSTVGRLTSEDVSKARNVKKTDFKQHKQVVDYSNILFHTFGFLFSLLLIMTNLKRISVLFLFFYLKSVWVFFFISAQWKSQGE